MKKLLLIPALLLAATAARTAEKTTMTPKETVGAAAAYAVPQDWKETFSLNQGDPQAALTYGLHRIKVRLAGGEKSRYKKAPDYLVGLEARSAKGKAPEKDGSIRVAGQKVMLHKRKVPVTMPLPDTGGPSTYADEEFCVVPAGKSFFVLSYMYEDGLPDSSYNGQKAWRDFLKSFRLKKKP